MLHEVSLDVNGPRASARRVGAMVRRYVYLIMGSLPRIVELMYWPLVQMLLWGFLQMHLARATSLDPDILFFDDPSALLDPLHSRHVDDIILGLRDATGATIVLVSHDLPSVFALADDALFLDGEKKTMTARGRPEELRDHCPDPKVRAFLTRGIA